MRSNHLYSQSLQLHTESESIYNKRKELPNVFYALLSDENVREITMPNHSVNNNEKKTILYIITKHKSEFLSNFRNKKHAIKSMFKIKNSVFDMMKN